MSNHVCNSILPSFQGPEGPPGPLGLQGLTGPKVLFFFVQFLPEVVVLETPLSDERFKLGSVFVSVFYNDL